MADDFYGPISDATFQKALHFARNIYSFHRESGLGPQAARRKTWDAVQRASYGVRSQFGAHITYSHEIGSVVSQAAEEVEAERKNPSSPRYAPKKRRVSRRDPATYGERKEAFTKRVLGDSRYGQTHRFPKWNIKPTVLEEPRLFRKVFPEIDKSGHVHLAGHYKTLAQKFDRQYYDAMKKAATKYGESGPQISAIGRAGNFPESVKDRLRTLAHSSTLAWKASKAHETASKLRGR